MQNKGNVFSKNNRRAFLKKGMAAAGAATAAGMVIPGRLFAASADHDSPRSTKGDIAVLRFLSAAEQVETGLWQQYSELGGLRTTNSVG